ncbi:MAG: hypothetical protein OSA97_13900 [Nevskia sp.]|nr:hypothetical protein [Nevskia sp.]
MTTSTRGLCVLVLSGIGIVGLAQAGGAPTVQLPQDAQRVTVATPLGGPTVTLPVREGIALTAPKVTVPALVNPPKVHTAEAGPVIYLPQH